ncbi:hypothetical protein PIB30_010582 [Stylosanthes scabra]|uniref:DUF8204 domain-containing protein n=1 Tax=Stylosanthes scabra TaxID=79078 RepID=A0ABU6S5Z5_9FABA|nr:hypothetical protein [Stylosanthes scabra]
MNINRDEAAASMGGGGGGEGEGEARNPARNENVNPNPNPNTNPNSPNNNNTTRGSKGRSCKGCAYYTSVHKSKSKNPTCIGISNTLPQVPPYVVGETELEASKEGRSLANFYYACIGYSVYLDNKESSADSQDKTAKLPFCTGLEVVLEEKSSTSPGGHVPTHAHKTEEQEHRAHRPHPQPQTQPRRYNNNKSPSSAAEEFLNRFQRNATLVAMGVVKDLNKVGNYIKETLVDILNRRPK